MCPFYSAHSKRRGRGAACGGGKHHPPPQGEPGLLSLVVIFGSLLLVAGWEFCRPRRQRQFPALLRRLGNVAIWVLNVILAGFTFEPVGTFRPQLEAAFGSGLPSWPVANRWASFVVAFLLLDFLIYAVHRCEHAMPFLWRLPRLASLRSGCRCHDVGAPSSGRVSSVDSSLLDTRGSVGYSRRGRADPLAGGIRRRGHARQHQPADMAGPAVGAVGDHCRLALHPPFDLL